MKGDIADADAVAAVYRDHAPTAVINFAAESHVDRSIESPRDFLTTNVAGTFELLEAARRHLGTLDAAARDRFRFLHVSTDEVYGTLGSDGLFSEDTPYAPNSPYSASKAAADHFVRAYQHTFGVPTLVTNCSNNYGPYQFPEKLIPLMILNALEGKPLPIYGDGGNIRDWLYVEDHCDGILQVLRKGRAGREVQHRRRQRAHQPPARRSPLCAARRTASRAREPGAAAKGHRSYADLKTFVDRSPGPRSPLRDRRAEDPPRDRLGAPPRSRERPRTHRALVPRSARTGAKRSRTSATNANASASPP